MLLPALTLLLLLHVSPPSTSASSSPSSDPEWALCFEEGLDQATRFSSRHRLRLAGEIIPDSGCYQMFGRLSASRGRARRAMEGVRWIKRQRPHIRVKRDGEQHFDGEKEFFFRIPTQVKILSLQFLSTTPTGLRCGT